MIPFASQRGGGQDLATHLQNEVDNESVEIYDLRGSVAEDLDVAFAEWKAQADNLTKCKNYLYSLSVNPDQRQGELTKEQYLDFLHRVEDALGLEHQPRALVFHIKEGREHLHAVYSRIDAEKGKAVHMPFDRDKLMMVTRKFAKDYGLQLPNGYFKDRGQHEGKGQLLLHEKAQQDTTGFSKEERMAVVTDIWRSSDSPSAFVAGLQDRGYMLCTGRRDYVLVDYYGNANALPRLIDDNTIRTQQIREFMGEEFALESLPDVDETRENIGKHRKRFEEHKRSQEHQHRLEQLANAQKRRRADFILSAEVEKGKRQAEILYLADTHDAEIREVERLHREKNDRILSARQERERTGLTAFLAKASGLEALERAVYRRQDRINVNEHAVEIEALELTQKRQMLELQYRLDAHDHDTQRKISALDKLEHREMLSLRAAAMRDTRTHQRKGQVHIPTAALELSPWGRKPNIEKAKAKHQGARQLSQVHKRGVNSPTTNGAAPDAKNDFQAHTTVSAQHAAEMVGDAFNDSSDQVPTDQVDENPDRSIDRSAPRKEPHRGKSGKRRK
ncbi:MAG: hypothetical protein Hals2KO_14980 [Halioglobus sp.]